MDQMTAPACWVDLSARTLIRVSGEDAATFLQGQLTQDVAALNGARALWAAHCSPKGRMLASFLLWKEGSEFWLDASEDLAEAALRRLRLYVLRSRVAVEDQRDARARFGICGRPDPGFWDAMGWPPAPAPGTCDRQADVLRVALSAERLLLVVPVAQATELRARLSDLLAAGSGLDWADAAVREGVAEIRTATQDEWVPQMINWDLVGGISFNKGCYTGQEIVARTHYLGKIKRRMLRYRAPGRPEIGQSIYGNDPETPVGKVALAGSAGPKAELLAVVHLDALSAGPLHLGEPDGPVLESLPLPYAVATD